MGRFIVGFVPLLLGACGAVESGQLPDASAMHTGSGTTASSDASMVAIGPDAGPSPSPMPTPVPPEPTPSPDAGVLADAAVAMLPDAAPPPPVDAAPPPPPPVDAAPPPPPPVDAAPPPPPPPECTVDADCADRFPNPTGCNINQCVNNSCVATPRYDSPTWVGTPIFSSEVAVSSSAASTQKVIWDGSAFLVVYGDPGLGLKATRVSSTGSVLSTFALDPAAYDLALVGDHYGVVTLERDPATGFNSVYAYSMSLTGDVIGAKQLALSDSGGNCPPDTTPDLVNPHIASTGWSIFVTAQVSCGFIVRGRFYNSGIGWSPDVSLYRPRTMVTAGGPLGYAAITEDLRIGGGKNEAYAQTFDGNGVAASTYHVIVPYVTNQPTVATLGMTAGSQTWLASYKRTGLMSFRPMSATGVMGTEVQFQSTGYGAYDTAAVSFDRANFLVVPSAYGTSLAGYRVTQGGANLDATPIALTPTDTAMESKPAIGSDGAGRHLVGYVKSTDGRVYARTFSTCPAP